MTEKGILIGTGLVMGVVALLGAAVIDAVLEMEPADVLSKCGG